LAALLSAQASVRSRARLARWPAARSALRPAPPCPILFRETRAAHGGVDDPFQGKRRPAIRWAFFIAASYNPLIDMIPVTETKSTSADVASAFEDFAHAFEAFKDANDTRLGEIETRLTSDVVTDEKLARIDAALDDAKRRLDRLALDRSRPPLAGTQDAARDPAQAEHKTAF
jgi:hypothetical protein